MYARVVDDGRAKKLSGGTSRTNAMSAHVHSTKVLYHIEGGTMNLQRNTY